MPKRLVAVGYVVVTCGKCGYDYPLKAGEIETADIQCPTCGTAPETDLIREGVRSLIRMREIQASLGDSVDFDDIRIRERNDRSAAP